MRFEPGAPTIEWRHRDQINLHPDLKVLLSTSGSTGSPKFVKLSHANIQSNARSIAEYLQLDGVDRAATSLKFNYSFGMSVLNSHLACGASLLLTDKSVTDRDFWTELRTHGATSFTGVPYTFELLQRVGVDWSEVPRLRYLAQAGGRLSPELVRTFARLGATHGWRFYVMYGQTEASPRMAYLPPERAAEFPECIGVAIPGGSLAILDDMGAPILAADQAGELVYSGPNVMMGHAQNVADLATDETAPVLLTGDIACRNEAGLYYIVGRRSRFIKPFGIRVNLDDVQKNARQWVPEAAATGTDERVILAVPSATAAETCADLTRDLASSYHLPHHIFELVRLAEIPRLETGKIDYQAILRNSLAGDGPAAADGLEINKPGTFLGTVMSAEYVRQVFREAMKILGFDRSGWKGVGEIFGIFASVDSIEPAATFRKLGGDSLSYVQVQMALEDYLGYVPDQWEFMTIDELEGLRAREAAL